MNANNEKCLGENTYKRNYAWERKRRIVVYPEDEIPEITHGWRPCPNLPIAPGLPDIIPNAYELGGYPTRSTCTDTMKDYEDGEEYEISFDLSKYRETNEEYCDDELSGIDTSFADFEYRKYMGDTFNENDWSDFDSCDE